MEFVYDDDLYAVLDIDPDASDDTIRKAYKKLAVALHPDRYVDKTPEEREQAQTTFAKVSYAYNVLKNPSQRNEYDFMRRMAVPPPETVEVHQQLSPQEQAERRERAERRFRQGIAMQMDKNIKGALDAFKEAVKIDPTVPQYHTMLAISYQKMGWIAYAQAEVTAALRLDPKDVLALKLRGQLHAAEKALLAEAESKQDKKKKKKKGKVEEPVIEVKAKRAKKVVATQQLSFKKKRTPLLQTLIGAIFKRK